MAAINNLNNAVSNLTDVAKQIVAALANPGTPDSVLGPVVVAINDVTATLTAALPTPPAPPAA